MRLLTIISVALGLAGSALIVNSCDTPDNVRPVFKEYFIKYYGEDGDQEGRDLVVNPDGTFIILGTTIFGQLMRTYLTKVDIEGNVIWKKILGSTSNEFAIDIEPINAGPDAGNFIVLSNVERAPSGYNIRLTVVSPNGDSLKSLLVDNLENQQGTTITPLSNGSYYLSGKSSPIDSLNAALPPGRIDEEDALVILVGADLSYDFPGSFSFIGRSYLANSTKIFEAGSAGFYYSGYTDEVVGTDNVFDVNFVFRVFIENPQSVPGFSTGTGTRNEFLRGVARSPFGTFMAVGTQTDNAGADRSIYLTSVAPDFKSALKEGNLVVGGGGQAEGVSVAPSGSSKFLVVGNTISASGNRNIYLAKIDFFFEKEFELTFGGPSNDDSASAVAELPNGDIIVLGTMNLTNQKKIALIKLRSNGSF